MIISCSELFDGVDFQGPAVLELDDGRVRSIRSLDEPTPPADAHAVDVVMPTLVDASVRCRGYRESAVDPPFAASMHILALHERYGIGRFKESGNSWEALHHLVDILGCDEAVLSGPVLVSGEPAHEVERPVADADAARRAVASARLEGAAWLMLGSALDPAPARVVLAEARHSQLPVAARPGRCSVAMLSGGGARAIHGAHLLLMGSRQTWDADTSPADLAQRWADEDPEAVVPQLADALLADDVALVPELLSFRRRVLIREAIDSPGLEDLVPILPAARFLLEMRRAGGYVLGRRQVASRAGLADLSRAQRTQAVEGLNRIAETTRLLHAGGVAVWPGSGAPSFGVTPGIGLLEELALLVDSGLPLERLLVAATSSGEDRLASGVGEGRLLPGKHARLAVARSPSVYGPLAMLASVRGLPIPDAADGSHDRELTPTHQP